MNNIFAGKKVLVTGGAGSIGSAIVHELVTRDCTLVRVLDMNETGLFTLQQELAHTPVCRFLVGDIRDRDRMRRAVEGIDIVIHAAALKHVQSSEYNPFEAVKTNVVGIQNLIDVCIEEDIERFLFTSSDKATNPTNVMGTTKLLGERLVTAANYYKGKRRAMFSSVRFGNVMGSQGSVVPLFMQQIQRRIPVTITDETMTRFVMSKQEAIGLIFKALAIMKGGEVFILKMPVFRVADLYRAVADYMHERHALSSTSTTIGLRNGEKMHEELMTAEESRRALETDDMFILLPEMKELLDSNHYTYQGARQASRREYSSQHATPLLPAALQQMIHEVA